MSRGGSGVRRLPLFLAVLVGVAVIAGGVLRFTNLGRKVYWNDEIWTSLWISGHSGTELEATVPVNAVIAPDDLLAFQRLTPGRGLDRSMAALAGEDPKQPALYLLLVRLWAGWVGDSPAAVRLFSAVVSLLVLPAAFWFCRELFGDSRAGWIAVLLVAASPFHILYAQEARPYSLWALWVFLSGASLLSALSRPSLSKWAFYSATIAAGLYSHTLFGLVLVGHAAFVWFNRAPSREARRQFAMSATAGVLLFLPWCYFILVARSQLEENTSWVAGVTGYPALVSRLSLSLALPFVDPGVPHGTPFRPTPGGFLVLALIVPALFLIGFALLEVRRRAAPAAALFVVTMIAPTALAMIFPDLVLGGSGITTARFLLPALVGLEVAVAFLLCRLAAAEPRSPRVAGTALAALLVAAGLGSAVRSAGAESWWNKYLNTSVPEVAAAVDATPKPLVLGDDSGLDLHRMIALAYRLDPRARILLVRDPRSVTLPEGYSDVFWYAARQDLRRDMERAGFRFEPAIPDRGLWRVERAK